MHTWHWQTWRGLPYLTCSWLEPWSHGFFTQQFAPQTPSQLVKVLYPPALVYRVKQVHGNRVLSTAEVQPFEPSSGSEPEPDLEQADGLVSQRSQQSVWVCSADCTPVLIGDTQTGQVAAIHAGWRGTAERIVPAAIARLQAQGSQLQHLRIALGPAIAGEVYQVSTAVAAKVGATAINADPEKDWQNYPEALLLLLQALPQPPILPDNQPSHARLDVRQVNRLQLEQLGISPNQIAISEHCTYQQPEYFFSYRRSNQKQVQWSGIVSNWPSQLLA
jgi:polyphenol oxidase